MKKIYLFYLLTIVLISCEEKYTGEVNFKSCKIIYTVLDDKKEIEMHGQYAISNEWRLESAMQDLALCLCESYLKNRDEEIKEKILELYNEDFEYYPRVHSFKKINFDSILTHRKEIFNPEILID